MNSRKEKKKRNRAIKWRMFYGANKKDGSDGFPEHTLASREADVPNKPSDCLFFPWIVPVKGAAGAGAVGHRVWGPR